MRRGNQRPTLAPVARLLGAVLTFLATLAAGTALVVAPSVAAQDEPPPAGAAPPGEVRLVPVPPGCIAPPLPDVVFAGTLVERDFRTGRFRIDQVRAGDPAPFAVDDLIDVRYGLDAEYLEVGESYVVSASREPVLGVLVSQIRPPAPDFGGDDVVGVAESDVECPIYEDPVRTVRPDGSSVESGVLTPLFEDRTGLLGALLVPVGVAFGVVFALALLRHLLHGVARGIGYVVRAR